MTAQADEPGSVPSAAQTPGAGAADAVGSWGSLTHRGWNWISCWCSWWTVLMTCWPPSGGCAGYGRRTRPVPGRSAWRPLPGLRPADPLGQRAPPGPESKCASA